MHILLRALAAFRAPLGVVLLAALVIIVPGQSREVFLTISEATGSEFLWQCVRVAAGLLLFSLALLGVGVIIVERPGSIRAHALSHHRVLMESLALTLPLVPLLSLVVALVDG